MLVDPEDHIDVADAVSEPQLDPELARRLGTQGRAHARELAWPLIAAQVQHLLDDRRDAPHVSRLNVLLVNHTSEISGGERSLLDLLRGLPSTVLAVVACPPGDLQDAARSADLEVRSLRGIDGSLRLHPLHSSRAAVELATAAVGLRWIALDHPEFDGDLVIRRFFSKRSRN